MYAVLAGEVRPVGLDPVGADQGAVQHQVVQPVLLGLAQCLAELGRAGRQQRHRLLHVSPRGSRRYPEAGTELGVGLALAQVDQHQQGLRAGIEPPPERPHRLAVPADHPGDVVQGLMRQIDGGTIEKHLKLLVATVWIVVINPSTRSFLLLAAEPRHRDHAVTRALAAEPGKGSLPPLPEDRVDFRHTASLRSMRISLSQPFGGIRAQDRPIAGWPHSAPKSRSQCRDRR